MKCRIQSKYSFRLQESLCPISNKKDGREWLFECKPKNEATYLPPGLYFLCCEAEGGVGGKSWKAEGQLDPPKILLKRLWRAQAVAHLLEYLLSMYAQSLWVWSLVLHKEVWWHMPVIPKLREWRQKDQKFLGYVGNSRPAGATRNLILREGVTVNLLSMDCV